MPRRLTAALAFALLVAFGGACTYGHEDSQTSVFRPLVFPGEARLGSSAFMVIDANDIPIGAQLERYDLHRARVEILVEGNLDTVPATLRSVFAVEAGRATIEAQARPNTWLMVAFFDLPDETAGAFSAPYPIHAPLHLEIDGVPVPELEGIVYVLGEGGSPTSMDATPLLPLLEDQLEPKTTVRLRPRGFFGEGFDPGWTVGGLSVDVHYDPDCLENPVAHLGSNATGGGVTLGPPAPVADPAGLESVRIVVSHPLGFTLPVESLQAPLRLGTGPILDVTFDRVDDVACSGDLDTYFWVRGLEVREIDGTRQVLRPFPSEVGTSGAISFDASEYFHFHYLDPDQPS